jgi:PhzF family phenazine biosynthesis protein
MQYKYYIADVFTAKPFNGAQIAVFPDADGLDKENMQLLARELNLSETAFVFSSCDEKKGWRMRIFTPLAEIDFAGHPIIAVGHVLASICKIKLEQKHTSLLIEQNIGTIEASITQEDGQPVFVQFEMKSQPVVDNYVPMEMQLAEMLCLNEPDIESIKYQTMLVSADQTYLVIPLRSFDAVRKAQFNYSSWSQSIAPTCMAREMLLFTTQSDLSVSNFHARLVGPDTGINEDPPIASAMPAFSGYLCAHKHVAKGRHAFVIDRGMQSTRKSVLSIEMDNNEIKENVIRVGGPAVIVGEGTITIPDK